MNEAIVVGCGLSGATAARCLAEKGYKVTIYEKRDHIAGNMYDYIDAAGILVHKYGPHTFHTQKKEIYDFIHQYGEWKPYKLVCGAVINGKYTPTPFDFRTVDTFFEESKAQAIKDALENGYPDRRTATVLELLRHEDVLIREYAIFLFDNDYKLYSAKQWGVPPEEIDPEVLKRVPIRIGYEEGYFDDRYQVMPEESYVSFFRKLLDHPNIQIRMHEDVMRHLKLAVRIDNTIKILIDGKEFRNPLVYTGAIDELFEWKYGELPYRSLRFEWKTENRDSFQDAPVVAYPQEKDYTRITEYKKLPKQYVRGRTTYAIEYSYSCRQRAGEEPYYPILNEKNIALYKKYFSLSQGINNLYLCGRLADYKYYNMDQALERTLAECRRIPAV